MIKLTIDDQPVAVKEGTALLDAIQARGIQVPTLCYHPALSAYGACRLCVVEVHAPGRAPVLQASCSCPAFEGLNVFTDTERVRRARKIVAELLLARCPESETIRRIAADYGVSEPRIKKKNDDCIYCGLCERICRERMGRTAISFSGRGPQKKLQPPFGKHNEMCWTCGACNFVCPVGKRVSTLTTSAQPRSLPDAHNLGLNSRPAIHIPYPQAIPNVPVIERESCIHLSHDHCGVCEAICQQSAIDYEQKEERVELEVGAVILSPGYEAFDATRKKELGYGVYPNVVTALEFERILSPSGPWAGEVLRPSDGKEPKKIAFIQCVGSRDSERDYCSSVCCMYATKQAIIGKEHLGEDLDCTIFFMDLRAFGKGFEEYYERAKSLGVKYIRCRPSAVEEMPESRNLRISYLDEEEKKQTAEYEMLILSVGLEPPASARRIAESFGIELNEFDFCRSTVFEPARTTRAGVYVAGAFSEPKDIPETVMQASGASSQVLGLLNEVRGSLMAPKQYPPEIDVTEKPPRLGVFVCQCGKNIGGIVNVPEVVEYAKTLPDVIYVEDNLYTCSQDTQELIKEKIREHELNRVIVAACTPRTHQPLFEDTIREVGLNPYLFEMANIRNQCSWVHMQEPQKATEKAKDLVRMAVAKAAMLEPLHGKSVKVEKSALVIGGGVSGMTAAAELAAQGVDVYLVEREGRLGGYLNRIHYLLNGERPQEALRSMIGKVEQAERIQVFKDAKIESIEGSVGNFTTRVATDEETKELRHGVVVVATGAREYRPKEYLYGEDERVLTQLELEERLAKGGGWLAAKGERRSKTVVMIQCVGSRDEERSYCSRICCSEAMKNALKIKELSPSTHVYVLYRDIRTYGFRESYYTEARRQGVIFLRYENESKPKVSRKGKGLEVEVVDQTLRAPIGIKADFIVLAAGIVPDEGNEPLGKALKVSLDNHGFFLEAHMKLRPVDFATDGVYLCGLAHSAKGIDEAIVQAQAAAARAASVLWKDAIEMDASTSHVSDENCDGCAYCVGICPFDAITLLEYMFDGSLKKVVDADESACKGCGSCQATCPKEGIYISGFKLQQIAAQVNAALGVM